MLDSDIADSQANTFPLIEAARAVGSFAYLDNSATTQKPERVIRAVENFYRSMNSNVHRGVYPLSEAATEAYEGARKIVADFLNCETDEVIFTTGATGSLNLLAHSLAHHFGPSDTILLSELEHHSNLLPWLRVAEERRCQVAWIPVHKNGSFDLEGLRSLLNSKPVKLVAFANISHVLGNHQAAEQIIQDCRAAGVWTVIDATQAAARERLDVKSLKCDALVFSGHKVYGPSGIGVLYASRALEEMMKPFHLGGGMVEKVYRSETAAFRKAPWKFEAGTPPIEAAVGLGEAIQFINDVGAFQRAGSERRLIEDFARHLAKFEVVRLHGWAEALKENPSADLEIPPHEGILSFSVDGLHAHDVAQTLSDHGVAVRAGQHCAQLLMEKMAPEGCVRISLAIYNSAHDLKIFETAFEECLKLRAELVQE